MPLKWTHSPAEHAAFDYSAFANGIISHYARLRFDPERKYAYSNVGYLVLGKMIEKVSGLSYASYITRNILEKLGIPNEDLGFGPLNPDLHATGYQKRYSLMNLLLGAFIDRKKMMKPAVDRKWKPFRTLFVNGQAYGGLIGNGRGIGIFLKDLLNENPVVLTEDSIRQMFTPQKTRDGKETGTSLGWFVGSLRENPYFCHAGGGGGYYCEVRIYPARKAASAIFLNASGMSDERLLDKTDAGLL